MPNKKTDAAAQQANNPSGMASVSRKIMHAITRKKYKARTISGISRETKLPRTVIVHTIRNNQALKEKIKIYPRRTLQGGVLITTKQKFDTEASFKDKFIDAFATVRTGLEDVD